MKGLGKKFILPAALCSVLAVACVEGLAIAGVESWTTSGQGADPIEGLWSSQVSLTNCSTGVVTRSFTALNLFEHGGTVLDTDNQPPTSHGPGFGVWASGGDLQYVSAFAFYRYNPDGSFAGTQEISRTITLSPDKKGFTSKISAALRDSTGTVIGTSCGTETASRPTPPPAPPLP